MNDDKEKKINQLKCELFEIIRQQEVLNNQFNQLQSIKSQKWQELQKLEDSNKDDINSR